MAYVKEDRPRRLDVAALRKDFPLLGREVNGHPIVYLDSASSAQRPVQVLDAMRTYDETTHANVHRGVYSIAEEATRRFEAARYNVGRFIGAPDPAKEIVFAKNATEGLNLVAHTWGRSNLHAGDAILLTEMEHHANIVPWHMLADERGLTIRWLPVDDDGRLDARRPRAAGRRGQAGRDQLHVQCARDAQSDQPWWPTPPMPPVPWCVADAAQSVPHLPTDVIALGVDFLAFSSHKMLGPTGIGVLWGRGRTAVGAPALPRRWRR